MRGSIARILSALPYLPIDRLHALARAEALPDRVTGAALLADISGFTPLADALAAALGAQRGAEVLTRHLNVVYGALIDEVHRYGGTVLGFSGDAITCFFGGPLAGAAARATTAAMAMQQAMRPHATVAVPGGGAATIALKVAVAAGPARRFRVGDPAIQVLDCAAGATLDRLAATEHAAKRDEVLVDRATAEMLEGVVSLGERRAAGAAVVLSVDRPAAPAPWAPWPESGVHDDDVRPWLLPQVYERLRGGQGEFLAELRPAVAVFLRFSGIAYDEDDDAGAKLDAFVAWVQRVLSRYEGTLVDITIGDKGSYLYCAFGAPTAHENDAERALRAALELRDPPDDLPFLPEVHLGVSRGRTRVGPIGGPTRRAYAVTGNEVNVAARLMQAAREGEVLVAAHVLDGVRAPFAYRALPPMKVKGRAEPLKVLALEAVEGRTISGVHAADTKPKMVGREGELRAALERLDRAAKGAGQVVAITADAGMGKSRLLAEVVRDAQGRGFEVHVGEAQSFGMVAAYLAWQPVWRGILGVDAALPHGALVSALERTLAAIDPPLVQRLPLLGPALGLPFDDNDLTRQFEAKLRKDSLEALLATCLRAHAARAPMLIALEDAHWMDALSIDLLESLGRAVAGMPVVLAITCRPHDADEKALARVAELPHFGEIRVAPLDPADAASLLRRLAEARFGPAMVVRDRFVSVLLARAEGNPFLIEELTGFLFDRGVTPATDADLATMELPTNLAGAILGRIDRLSVTQQTTLKVASVIGRTYPYRWLWGVHPDLGPEARVRADLAELDRFDFTSLESPDPEETWTFKHSMIHEVAYDSLPYATRGTLHERLGCWLEAHPDAAPPVDLLAFHFGRSDNKAKQREYFKKAAEAAVARYANDAAAVYFERLLELVEEEEQPEILFSLGMARQQVSRWDEAERHYDRALGQVKDERLRARICLAMGAIGAHRGAYDHALRWLADARKTSDAARDRGGTVTALIETANSLRLQGRLDEASSALDHALLLEGDGGDKRRIARAYHVYGNITLDRRDVKGARRYWSKSLDLRRELGDRPGITIMVVNTAGAAFLERNFADAAQLLHEAQTLSNELGMRLEGSRAGQLLALVIAAQGDFAGARTLLLRSLAVLRDLGALRDVAELLVALSSTWRASEDDAEALQLVRLSGAGATLFEQVGSPIPPQLTHQLDADLAALRARAGVEAVDAAWTEGRALEWAAAVSEALALGRTPRQPDAPPL